MEDVLIVGGGIIGLLCALELNQRGRQVRVVSAPQSMPSASWAGGGILSALYPWRYPDELTVLTHDALQRYQAWNKKIIAAGIDAPEINQCGLFAIGNQEREIDQWGERFQVPIRYQAIDACWPDWQGERGLLGYWWPQAAAVRNPRMLKALQALANQQGVAFTDAIVDSVDPVNNSLRLQNGNEIKASDLIVAAGAWSQSLLAGRMASQQGTQLDEPLFFPAKGQMLLYQLPKQICLPGMLLSEQGYLIPRQDGLVLVGSTLEIGISDMRPTQQGSDYLKEIAGRLMPALRRLQPQAQWSGVRPGCQRKTPIISSYENSWLVTGHFRNGLVSAPGSAELLAQLVCGEPTFTDSAPYQLLSSS